MSNIDVNGQLTKNVTTTEKIRDIFYWILFFGIILPPNYALIINDNSIFPYTKSQIIFASIIVIIVLLLQIYIYILYYKIDKNKLIQVLKYHFILFAFSAVALIIGLWILGFEFM
ncbi:MAG: hypothetical protein WDZ29_05035 [Balneolaceae bacterium]